MTRALTKFTDSLDQLKNEEHKSDRTIDERDVTNCRGGPDIRLEVFVRDGQVGLRLRLNGDARACLMDIEQARDLQDAMDKAQPIARLKRQ